MAAQGNAGGCREWERIPHPGDHKGRPYGGRGSARVTGRDGLMLRLPAFRYLAPRTLDEAAHMLAQEGEQAMLVAGGTDLYPNMKRRQFTPPALLGLRRIVALRGISGPPEEGMRVGAVRALTT